MTKLMSTDSDKWPAFAGKSLDSRSGFRSKLTHSFPGLKPLSGQGLTAWTGLIGPPYPEGMGLGVFHVHV